MSVGQAHDPIDSKMSAEIAAATTHREMRSTQMSTKTRDKKRRTFAEREGARRDATRAERERKAANAPSRDRG